jgi:hypothetical protein
LKEGAGGVSLVVGEQRLPFIIEERLRQVRHELTRAEQLALQRPYPPKDIRKWDYQPDGVLVLERWPSSLVGGYAEGQSSKSG